MASTPPPSKSTTTASSSSSSSKPLSFFAYAMKNKQSCIHVVTLTGILLLNVRWLGHSYRAYVLENDVSALREEQQKLKNRMNNIKRSLLVEAARDSTGRFASQLRRLFDEN